MTTASIALTDVAKVDTTLHTCPVHKQPAIPGTISMLSLQPVLFALRPLDIDLARVLARASLTVAELDDPNARMAAGVEFVLWDAIEEISGDSCIALRIADRIPLGTFGAYEYLLHNSATMRSGIERAARYAPLIDELLTLTLVENDASARLRLSRVGDYPLPRQSLECVFAVIVRLLGDEFAQGHPLEVHFTHSLRGPLRERTERFQCPVHFDRSHNEIVFSSAMLDRERLKADTRLGQVLEEHVQHSFAALPTGSPLVQKARKLLAVSLAKGDTSLETLADALHTSARTLRRQLEAQGTSYKHLLDELRKELAYQSLARTDESFAEIGTRLGFAESSAFYRAFKRWSGTTPAAYREEHRKHY